VVTTNGALDHGDADPVPFRPQQRVQPGRRQSLLPSAQRTDAVRSERLDQLGDLDPDRARRLSHRRRLILLLAWAELVTSAAVLTDAMAVLEPTRLLPGSNRCILRFPLGLGASVNRVACCITSRACDYR
jgi:hypothetical protein